MAQKKLLLSLVCFLITLSCFADLEKHIEEFQQIQKEKLGLLEGDNPSGAALLVFISSSMSKNNIKEILNEAKDSKATLVLQGFIDGSFKKTMNYIQAFYQEGEESVGLIIDPTLFDQFEVKMVPTFVLSKGNIYDKLMGNISLNKALEIFEENGDLSGEAKTLLKVGKQ